MSTLPRTYDELTRLIEAMAPDELDKLTEAAAPYLQRAWLPQPGPQSDAYYCEADELLYGGAAGGGKTDLGIGLALTAHERSLIIRAQATDLEALWDRLMALASVSRSNSNRKQLYTTDRRTIEGGHLDKPNSERSWQGRPHDLIYFDEVAQLAEHRVVFLMQWLRSTTPGQRKRVVMGTNPPLPEIRDGQLVPSETGAWLISWFAPWIDPMYPRPAKPGELRWCYMRSSGRDYETVWVDGPGFYDIATAEPRPDATERDILTGKIAAARSRTFIRSRLADNAYLAGTGYAEKLSGIPEPMRSMLLNGEFGVRLGDDEAQVIPTAWVLAAEERWRARPWAEVERLRQVLLSCDIAQGGVDNTIIAPIYEGEYVETLLKKPGLETPTGHQVVKMLMNERTDASMIVLDGNGGWAGSTRDLLQLQHQIEAVLFSASSVLGHWTPDGRFRYHNERARMWWTGRLLLDPQSGFGWALPPDIRLRMQLTAPRFYIVRDVLHVEEKADLRKRLQSSTDEADAVLQGMLYYEEALRALARRPQVPIANQYVAAQAVRKAREAPDDDGTSALLDSPLKDW